MKKFIRKILLFLVLMSGMAAALVLTNIYIVGNQYTTNYQASMIDKIARLKSIQEPKIILVGNSNLAFGIDSPELERAMGMPVVNLGLNGALNNCFHEQMAGLNAGSGDIIVICHTSYDDDDTIGSASLAWITLEKNWDLWPVLRPKDYTDMLLSAPRYLKESTLLWLRRLGNQEIDSCYSRTAFNRYGDIAYRPDFDRDVYENMFRPGVTVVPKISRECVARLNQYTREMQEKGAFVVVAGIPIPDGEYTPPPEEYDTFQTSLTQLLDCDVISNFRDYFFPCEYFYNTSLHLTEEGARERTRRLILDLQNWMSSNPEAQAVFTAR